MSKLEIYLNETEHKPGKDVYKKLKLGDTVEGVSPEKGLILNGKVLSKSGVGYKLQGENVLGDKIDVFLEAKELDYITKNWKRLK